MAVVFLIAQRYLVPRLLEEHGLTVDDVHFSESILHFITSRYSREAGLRTFERSIASVLRKRARAKADGEVGLWDIDLARVDFQPCKPCPLAKMLH